MASPTIEPRPATRPARRRALRWALVVALVLELAGASWYVWNKHLRDRFLPKRWSEVEPGWIFRSARLSEQTMAPTLREHNIRVIVDLTSPEPDQPEQQIEARVAAELGIEHRRFTLLGDGTGPPDRYAGAIAAVVGARRQGKPVLIHCDAGVNRTGAVVALYRVLVQRWPTDAARDELLQRSFDPGRNPRLIPHLNASMPAICAELVRLGVLDKAPDPMPVFPQP